MSEFINTIDVLGDDAVIDSIIDRSITEFKDDVITKIGDTAFKGCAHLTTLDLPNCTSSGVECLADCTALVELNLPKLEYIGYTMFGGCKSLVELCLPSATSMSNYLFNGMTSVILIDLPVMQRWTAHSPFRNCNALRAFVLRSETLCVLVQTALNFPSQAYIYVPRALLSDTDETKDYRRATNWSVYADQFRAIEDYTVDGTTMGELDKTKI